MAVKKILPKENLRAVDVRDTLLAHGADWSNVDGNKSANYLPNYFKKEAKINKWSKRKPVCNEGLSHEDFDFPKNRRGVELFGIEVPTRGELSDVHDIKFKYNQPTPGSGYPLRFEDFTGYNPLAFEPVTTDINIDKLYINATTFLGIYIAQGNEYQISMSDLTNEDVSGWYLGAVVDNMVLTKKPEGNLVELEFGRIAKEGDEARMTLIMSDKPMASLGGGWTNIIDVGLDINWLPLPGYIGMNVKFDRFKAPTTIGDGKYSSEHTLYGGWTGLDDDPMKMYSETFEGQGEIPKAMLDGFEYEVEKYSWYLGGPNIGARTRFNPDKDLYVRSDGSWEFTLYYGSLFEDYNKDMFEERQLYAYVRERVFIKGMGWMMSEYPFATTLYWLTKR